MKLIINQELLIKPLSYVANIIERRSTIPILGSLLIEAKNSEIKISATNLEMELTTTIKIGRNDKRLEIISSGQVVVMGQKLIDIIRLIDSDTDLTFALKEERYLSILGKEAHFRLNLLKKEDFPNFPKIKATAKFSIRENILKNMLKKVYFSMANHDVRQYLNGMLFHLKDKRLYLVTSDSHRLALIRSKRSDLDEGEYEEIKSILPNRSIIELMKLLSFNEHKIQVITDGLRFQIEATNFTFTTRLIDSNFPDYMELISQVKKGILIINREHLKNALLRATVLFNEKYRSVRILLKNNLVEIFANNREEEHLHEKINANYEGSDLEIGFKVDYLLEVSSALQSEDIKISFIDNKSRINIYSMDDKNVIYVIMPVIL